MCRYQVVVWILQYLKYSFAKEVFILLHHTYIYLALQTQIGKLTQVQEILQPVWLCF